MVASSASLLNFLVYLTVVPAIMACLDTIVQLQVFKPGEEPLIAAALIDLFALLPEASNFVESLVQQTVQLEVVLNRYKPSLSTSPFRAPLAKYLNRHYSGKYTCTCLPFHFSVC